MRWAVEHARGTAATLEARATPEGTGRRVWFFEVERPTLVLGRSQRDNVVDRGAAAQAGVQVVKRQSGGGLVLLTPGDVLWADVFVPADDLLWERDVVRAAWWVGDAWARALGACGFHDADVHRGPLVRTEWSALVCFAGLGPGEVSIEGRKAVGLSQRRGREGVLFQCAVYRHWDLEATLSLLAPPRPDLADIPVAEVPVDAYAVAAAFLAALPG